MSACESEAIVSSSSNSSSSSSSSDTVSSDPTTALVAEDTNNDDEQQSLGGAVAVDDQDEEKENDKQSTCVLAESNKMAAALAVDEFIHKSNLNSIKRSAAFMSELEQSLLTNPATASAALFQPMSNQAGKSMLQMSERTINAANHLNASLSIQQRLAHLYLNESLADVHFLVTCVDGGDSKDSGHGNSNERLPAHKLILSIGSQVFMAMFFGSGTCSHSLKQPSDIRIPDVEAEAFKRMLRYLYTDEVHVDADTVMSMLYAAKKYALVKLESACVDYLKLNLKEDNAFMLLQQANMFDETQLVDKCLHIIDNAPESFASDAFLDIDQPTLVDILRRDTLDIKELKLYQHVLRWAQHQCARRRLAPTRDNQIRVLGGTEAIELIRFPLMDKEEFAMAMNDPDTRLIDDNDIVELFVNLTLVANATPSASGSASLSIPSAHLTTSVPPRVKLKYNCKSRGSSNKMKEQCVSRFGHVESRWGYSGTSDRVRFSTNRRVCVTGFGLYGSIYGEFEYEATIQLIHYETCTTRAHHTTTFVCDGTSSTFRVNFKEPVVIEADNDYIVSVTLKGPDSFYGTKGMRKVIVHEENLTGKIQFHFHYANGNNNGTSVEDGQIPEIYFFHSPTCNNSTNTNINGS